MAIHVEEESLKQGLLGLVIALVEIIRDALKHQACRRMEGGSLEDDEIERLGNALRALDEAIEDIKREQHLHECTRAVRDGLDDLVDDVIDRLINPERWAAEE